MFDWLKPKPILDEDSIIWLFDTFKWAEQNLDPTLFYQQTDLILPDDQFFPVPKSGEYSLAQVMFDKVLDYTHCQTLPCELIEQAACQTAPIELPALELAIRGQQPPSIESLSMSEMVASSEKLPIIYNPAQVRNPQAMIGYFAQTIAYFVLLYSPNKPEDVADNIWQLSEVLAVFMGFGVIQANSAFNFKSTSCGSCQTPTHDRNSYLSQFDITYALAIFCVIKKIDQGQILKHLKGNLKSFFKKAYKQVQQRPELSDFQA